MRKINFIPALMLVVMMTGCGGDAKKDSAVGSHSVKVKVMQTATETSGTALKYSGTVEEENGTTVSFAVAGTVSSVKVNLGDHVRKGQLIATLDPATLRNTYEAAKSTLTQAEDAWNRMKKLHENGSLPDIKWVEVNSKLEQARSMESIARKNMNDSRLLAPFDGVVAEKSAEAGQNVIPGMPVVKLVTVGSLKVKVSVPESEVAKLQAGQKATITVPALDNKTFTATVQEKGILANPLSRSYDVKLHINGATAQLMPGMVADVAFLSTAVVARCVVPANVVQLDEQNQQFVWVTDGGTARKRIITVGEFTSTGVTIESGLAAGDKIIVEGQQKVSEGMKVEEMKN